MTTALKAPHDDPRGVATQLRELGVPWADALAMHRRFDAGMGQAILDLYRSATPNPYADWGAAVAPTDAPGLVLSAAGDPFDDAGTAGEVARRLGARTRVLEGVGHFWMLEDPAGAAEALNAFWDAVE
jgi:pimeloyl-ACP methyl ester carboxylesterase